MAGRWPLNSVSLYLAPSSPNPGSLAAAVGRSARAALPGRMVSRDCLPSGASGPSDAAVGRADSPATEGAPDSGFSMVRQPPAASGPRGPPAPRGAPEPPAGGP